MDLQNKHKYFLELAKVAAKQTKCLKRKVGAVIVDDQFHVKAIGYNGVPKDFPHCEVCLREKPELNDKLLILQNCPGVHAEANALLQLENIRHAKAIYVTTFPCIHCTKLLANTNIKNIFYIDEYDTDSQDKETILNILNNAEIIITKINQEEL